MFAAWSDLAADRKNEKLLDIPPVITMATFEISFLNLKKPPCLPPDSKKLKALPVSVLKPLLYGNPGLMAGNSVANSVCLEILNCNRAKLSNVITPTELSGELTFKLVIMFSVNSLTI